MIMRYKSEHDVQTGDYIVWDIDGEYYCVYKREDTIHMWNLITLEQHPNLDEIHWMDLSLVHRLKEGDKGMFHPLCLMHCRDMGARYDFVRSSDPEDLLLKEHIEATAFETHTDWQITENASGKTYYAAPFIMLPDNINEMTLGSYDLWGEIQAHGESLEQARKTKDNTIDREEE